MRHVLQVSSWYCLIITCLAFVISCGPTAEDLVGEFFDEIEDIDIENERDDYFDEVGCDHPVLIPSALPRGFHPAELITGSGER